MKKSLSNYEQGVFNFIDNDVQLGNVIVVSKWSKPETRNDFISAIKKRIDIYGDCEFNIDYTKFKKIETWEEIKIKWNIKEEL